MYIKTGVADQELVVNTLPSDERRKKGPYVFIECYQEIPCDPCTKICPFGSILPMDDINDLPRTDYDTCTGCTICAAICPGLAIFIIDETYSETEGTVTIPYEFAPLPAKGDIVEAMNRAGEVIGEAEVLRVNPNKRRQSTALVTLIVPKDKVMEVRFLRPKKDEADRLPKADPNSEENLPDSTVICRCENVTLGEIRALIDEGYDNVDEIKRISRAGMGPCQGRTCRPLIMGEINRRTGKAYDDIELGFFRPPTKPIQFEQFLGGEEDDN